MSRLHRLWSRTAARPGRDTDVTRVGDASFRFLGFKGRPEEALFSRFDYVAEGLPPLLELEEVSFAPDQRCLYDSDGQRIDETKVTFTEPGAPAYFNEEKFRPIETATMPERFVPPAGARRFKEPVLLLGEVHDHWGHFITDSMSRMWALDQLPRSLKVLFAPDPKLRIDAPLVRELLAALDLEDRLIRPDGPTIFEKVFCPIPAMQLSRTYQAFDAPHRHVAMTMLKGAAAPPQAPVYLTRSRLEGGLRQMAGEEELEARLEGLGFLIVSPERLSLRDQMAIFNGRHAVIGAFGSAMHTVLFRRERLDQPVATLFPGKIPPRFMMVDAVKAAEAAYIRCIRFEGEPEAGGGGWRLDPRLAMKYLDAVGLLDGAGR